MRTVATVGSFVAGMYCLFSGYYWWAFFWMLLAISPFVLLLFALALILIISLLVGCTTTTYNTTNNVNVKIESPQKIIVRDPNNPYKKEIK